MPPDRTHREIVGVTCALATRLVGQALGKIKQYNKTTKPAPDFTVDQYGPNGF